MTKITEKKYTEIINKRFYREWTPFEKKLMKKYRIERNKRFNKEFLVSGLVALTLIGSALLVDVLTPQEIKKERKEYIEKIAKEMPYGLR